MKTLRSQRRTWQHRQLAAWLGGLMIAATCSAASLRMDDDPLAALRRWSADQPAAVVRRVEALAREAATSDDAARAALARRLEALLTDDSTADAKDVTLRQLALIGDEQSVPAIAPLLKDPRLGHLAAAALGSLPADDDRTATGALAAALAAPAGAAGDATKVALIEALRRRGDDVALAAVAPIASAGDAGLRIAAITALGEWPSRGGASALGAIAPQSLAAAELDTLHTALLRAATARLAADDAPLATTLLRNARSIESSDGQRLASARLALLVSGGDDPSLLLDLLTSERPGWRDSALELVRSVSAPGMTMLAVNVLPQAPEALRPALVKAIGERGDQRAREAVERLAEAGAEVAGSDPALAAASCAALGRLGDRRSVGVLLTSMAAAQPEVVQAAEQALATLRGEEIDQQIATGLGSDATLGDDAKRRLCRVLVARRAASASPALLALAKSSSAALRNESIAALGSVARLEEIPELAAMASAATDLNERGLISAVLLAACRRAPVDQRAAPLIAMIDGAAPGAAWMEWAAGGVNTRSTLLPLLGRLGGADALACVERSLRDPASRVPALVALGVWPDASAASLAAAVVDEEGREPQRGPQPNPQRTMAFSAWVRSLSNDRTAPPAERVAAFKDALRRANDDAERKAVIAALASVPDRTAMAVLLEQLGNDPVREDAMASLLSCAAAAPTEQRRDALDAIRQVAAAATTAGRGDLRQRAAAAADGIERDLDFILSWQIAGPFEKKGVGLAGLMSESFAPESAPDGPQVFWRELRIDDPKRPGVFDLAKALGPGDDRVAYLRTRLFSPFDQRVRLELGSDDGVKLWVNGEVVHEKNAPRGLKPGEDVVKVPLRRGWNTLLAKVTQGGGDWALCARVRGVDGFPADGVVAFADPRRAEPLPGALMLLDGTDPASLAAWQHRDGSDAKWGLADGGATVAAGSGDLLSRHRFGDCTLHAEFLCPDNPPEVTGQARSNSGIYLQDRYEVQILDAFGEAPASDRVGGIYGRFAPLVNAGRRPAVWQDVLIDFTAPRWDESDPANPRKLSNARMTVWLNGVRIHDDVEVEGSTGVGAAEGLEDGPLRLQDHGNPVRFRNIWIVPRHGWEGPKAAGFTPLFDGTTLGGWTPRGGKAAFRVEEGAIVGETRPNQPNTFLCTDREFGDFVLELEFKIDEALNSGVQVRSAARQEGESERIVGYQCEIDPAQRAWTGGIYDEARRGWLASLSEDSRARAAFRSDEWNRLRVDARGPEIRTWVNGVPTAVLWDALSPRGLIGLQVHGVGARTEPLQVRWRDLRVREAAGR